MNFDLHSHKAHLVFTAVAASVATYGVLTAYQGHERRKHRRQLNDDVMRSLESQDSTAKPPIARKESQPSIEPAPPSQWENPPEELIREQLARVYSFFGDEGMARIRRANVVVVGCGGVGSWAAVMLVRS